MPAMNLLEISLTLMFFSATLISLYGYGAFISRHVLPDWSGYAGINVLIGLLLFLAASGYVELFHLGSQRAFQGAIFLGLVFALHSILRSASSFSWKKCSLDYKKTTAILIAIGFAAIYCINMIFHAFNYGDDYSSYLIFPLRILSEGFSGGDAFNLRGVEHGLGGGDYINALILSMNSLSSLYLAESGLGFLLLGLLCIDQSRISKQGFWISCCAFIAASITAIFAQYTNVTPILSGCAIGYGMLLIGARLPPRFSPKFSLLLGLLCGALIVLKGNLLAPALMFLGVIFLARLIENPRSWVLGELIACLAATAVIMLPWMLASKVNHGTLFYPLLGKGFTYSGGFALVPAKLFWGATQEFFPLYGLTLANWIVFWTRSENTRQIRFVSILCIALIPCTLILALTPAGMYRYCYAILATPCLYLVISNICIMRNQVIKTIFFLNLRNTRYLIYFIIFVSSILMLHQTKRVGSHFFNDSLYKRHIAVDQNNLTDIDVLSSKFPSAVKSYSAMQSSIPPGAVALVQVEIPFLLDFSRNKIWVMDYPGSAGPKPPPYDGTTEDLAKYFRDHHIRYIMHSYRAWITRRSSEHYITVELNPAYEWNRVMVNRELLVNNQLLSLGEAYTSPYDDGSNRVIDLCRDKNQSVSLCD